MRFGRRFWEVLTYFLTLMSYNEPKASSHSLTPPTQHPISKDRVMADLPETVHPILDNIGPHLAHLDKQFSSCGLNRIDIRELSILQVQTYFQNGQLCSTELTLCYLKRILVMNPYLKAVIEINPDAVRIAMKSDMERMLGFIRNPIHGVPILIKDNMATLDMMQTTVGALAMQYLMPREDADVVKRLREAGAVILGKSNPSEWADFRGTNVPGGWSGRGGQTRSPYVLSSDPSGSSTGSAVGVAANLAMVALGTETDGSIINPSSLGSLVGLKPTLKSVSMRGIIPLSFSQDVIGPIARSLADVQIVFDVISNSKNDFHNIKTCQLGIDVLGCRYNTRKRFRIGIVRDPFWNSSDPRLIKIIPQLEAALKTVQATGKVKVIDSIKGPSGLLDKVTSCSERTVIFHEFKYGINKYLQDVKHQEFILGRRIQTLNDIIQFNINNPVKGYDQDYLLASEATDGINNQTYKSIRDTNKAATTEFINRVLDDNGLDAMVGPCDSKRTLMLHNIGSIAGYPSVTVPAGVMNDGIPFGICFLGRPNSEGVLLEIGSLFEKRLAMRRMPSFYS